MFGDKKYNITVKDARTGLAIATRIQAQIYQAGTKTLATLYAGDNRSAKANSITRSQFDADGELSFTASDSSVDIFVNDELGNSAFVAGLQPTDHVIVLDRSGIDKCFVAPFIFNAGGTEVDTGLDFPLNCVIRDIVVEVTVADATETLNVGILSSETNGDADGLAVGVPLDAVGFIRPFATTDGVTEDYVSAAYSGALIGLGSTGTNTANDFGQFGGFGHVVQGANGRSLSYQPSTSDTAQGFIYAYFRQLR